MNGSGTIQIRRDSKHFHGVLLNRVALLEPSLIAQRLRSVGAGVELDDFEWCEGEFRITGSVHGIPATVPLNVGPASKDEANSLMYEKYTAGFELSIRACCDGTRFDNTLEFLFLSSLSNEFWRSICWDEEHPDPCGRDDLFRLGLSFSHKCWVIVNHVRAAGRPLLWNSPHLLYRESECDRRENLGSLHCEGVLERTDDAKSMQAPGLSYRMTDAYRAALVAEIPALASVTGPEGQS